MAKKVEKVALAPSGESELVVMAREGAMLRAAPSHLESLAGSSVSSAEKKLKKYNAVMKPMFGSSEDRIVESMRMGSAAASAPMTDLSVFYRIEVPDGKREKLRKELEDDPLFEAAYIKPPIGLPEEANPDINTMTPEATAAPSSTQNYSDRQIYLNASPEGVDARWAWTQSGGRGHDVRIIDIEGNWVFSHEDLIERQGGVLGGTVYNDVSWRNHGTAVLGEYGGDVNGFGVTGICSDAITSAVSHGSLGSSGAINHAASRLRAGDIMLLEMHRPGPRHNFAWRGDQRGYIAVEWWPDDYAAIVNATRQGIIIVEAAGNGAEDLDDAIYEIRPTGFPASWTNPFRRSNRDSGAIVVGAGAPPPGTHGRDHGADRSRLGFSNYGALIDAQGWGREVTTCGYGDLQGGSSEDLWYTDRFSGTSSASPIVVGAIGSIQGMAKSRGRSALTPTEFRNVLRTTGSPQQNTPGRPKTQRIGNRPDIPDMARKVFGASTGTAHRIAFRRPIDRCRPAEIRALLDASQEIACYYDSTTLQGGLISAQSLRQSDSGNLDDMAILFRFSDVQGQSVEIVGALGGGRYSWIGWIAADGLGQVSYDRGFSTNGSDYFDLLANIQGSEVRFVFNDNAQMYEPATGTASGLLRTK